MLETSPYPERIAETPFAEMWLALPDLQGDVDPFDFPQRMALFKRLIDCTNIRDIFGEDNRNNIFWGYVFQTYWQWRSGRYTFDAAPSSRIDPDTIWSYGNFCLSAIPLIAAVAEGLTPSVSILAPQRSAVAYAAGGGEAEYRVPDLLLGALEEWRAFFRFIKSTPASSDLEPVRRRLWQAHGSSLVAAGKGIEPLKHLYSDGELIFFQGWIRMVDFLAAAAWRTDLEFMLANGMDQLPDRVLRQDDAPGSIADMSPGVNSNLRNMFDLVKLPEWRFRINLFLWRRAMRTRQARDEVLPMLDATFNPSPRNAAERRRLLRYMLRPF